MTPIVTNCTASHYNPRPVTLRSPTCLEKTSAIGQIDAFLDLQDVGPCDMIIRCLPIDMAFGQATFCEAYPENGCLVANALPKLLKE